MTLKIEEKNFSVEKFSSALIIGGLGFIGGELSFELLHQNCFVYCLDNLNWQKKENLKELEQYSGFRFFKIKKDEPLKDIKDLKFDFIFHLLREEEKFWALKHFLQLSQKQKAKFLLLSSFSSLEIRKKAENLTSQFFSQFDLDVRITRIRDVYGPRMDLRQNTEVGLIFSQLLQKNKIKISGDGSQAVYPLYIKDAVAGLLKAMFSFNSKGKVYSLAGKEIKLMEFISEIKKVSKRTVGIEFISREKIIQERLRKKAIEETKKQLNWQPKTSLSQGIEKTLLWLTQLKIFPTAIADDFGKKQKWKLALSIFFLCFLIIFTPFISFAFYYFKALAKMNLISQQLRELKIERLEDRVKQANIDLQRSRNILLKFAFLNRFAFWEKPYKKALFFLDSGLHLTKISLLVSNASSELAETANIILGTKKGNLEQKIENISLIIQQLWDEYNLIEAEKGNFFETKEELKLPFDKNKIELAKKTLKILPLFLGLEEKEKITYLVLLQNNYELRATGGFIDGIGFLSLNQGRIFDWQTNRTAVVDSLLSGQIQPPEPISKYLGEKTWYLRDSNWQANFPDTSRQAQWLINKSLAKDLDGVLALNFECLAKLLEAVGPVKISGEDTLITAQNLKERAIFQKRRANRESDFILQLSAAILEKMKVLEKEDWLKVISSIWQSLEEKELLLSLNNPKASSFFQEVNWDGSIRNISKQEQLLADYLMIVESNLGVNQANYFLDRQISQKLKIEKNGEIKEETIISYFNHSSLLRQPHGDYKNYLRLYLPLKIKNVSFFAGRDLAKLEPLSNEKIKKRIEYEKNCFEIYLEVLQQEGYFLKITYQLEDNLRFIDNFASLAFLFQKQPGMGASDFIFSVEYPLEWKVLETIPFLETKEKIHFKTKTEKDKLFFISFAK